MKTEKEKVEELASYLKGFADSIQNEQIAESSKWLKKLARNICGQGFVGCNGGNECGSDHK